MAAEDEVPGPKQADQGNPLTEGLAKEVARDVGKELVGETKATFRWALRGAIVGAMAVGGVGFWLLGIKGLGIGVMVGAVIGAIAGAGVYLWGTSLSL